jgi:hypothetical protein
VLAAGGTVWASNDLYISVLSDGMIYWIHRAESPQFKKVKFTEGEPVWFYHAKGELKILSIIPGDQAQSLAELPEAEPIEIEAKRFQAEKPEYDND